MPYTVEICANSVQSAVNAQKAGSQRVELCDNLWEAGTTPSAGTIELARELLQIDLYVLVRPRGGDFVYSPLELEQMKKDIDWCKKLGVDGIVSGCLTDQDEIDVDMLTQLVEHSRPLKFTFHRAFDRIDDSHKAIKTLVNIRVDRVLTSGKKGKAVDSIDQLNSFQESAGDGLKIIAGGGINASNIDLLLATSLTEFHLSANKIVKGKSNQTFPKINGSSDIPENDYKESSIEEIQQVVEKIKMAASIKSTE